MRDKIKKFIVNNFSQGEHHIKDDQSLFESGLIDSFNFVVLLAYLEKEFKVRFDRSAIMIENFNTVNNIIGTINKATKIND